MAFEFVDLRRGDANRYAWLPPFDESQRYDHDRWWDEVDELDPAPWFVQVLDGRTEVARIKVDGFNEIGHYTGVPDLGPEGLAIELFEVAIEVRGRGVGTQVVQEFARRHPDRRLLAFSERADAFWASLGWPGFLPSDYDPDHEDPKTLFVAPPRWQASPESETGNSRSVRRGHLPLKPSFD